MSKEMKIYMNSQLKICDACGEPLKQSQYASVKLEGQPAEKEGEELVCRNYPDCPEAEKEC